MDDQRQKRSIVNLRHNKICRVTYWWIALLLQNNSKTLHQRNPGLLRHSKARKIYSVTSVERDKTRSMFTATPIVRRIYDQFKSRSPPAPITNIWSTLDCCEIFGQPEYSHCLDIKTSLSRFKSNTTPGIFGGRINE